MIAKLMLVALVILPAHCIPDCEHTYQIVIDCNQYPLLGPAIYQPALLQWCPVSI